MNSNGVHGRAAWEERTRQAGSAQVRALLERDFPSQLPRFDDAVGRRDFLHLMGASLALAGLGSCTRQPTEKILPYAKRPEDVLPGEPLQFATGMTLGGATLGLLVESHEGRPTKIEGNPAHPASQGATGSFAQAATLGLYDPDRSRVVLNAGEIRTWEAFHQALEEELGREDEDGQGVRILTARVVSPSLAAELRKLLARWPRARWVQWEALNADGALRAAQQCFGRAVDVRYDFARADVVLTLDADFLTSGPGHVRYARDFSTRRRVRDSEHSMNRLYAVESGVSITGAFADHRLALKPSQIESFARRIARGLGAPIEVDGEAPESWGKLLRALARDLREHAGRCLIVAGAEQSAEVHALAHWMNAELGNVGATLEYIDPVVAEPSDCARGIAALTEEMRAGEVRALFVLGGNPVYDAPADCGFRAAYVEVPFRVHLSLYEDETSRLSHWHLPESHFLESWSDGRAYDGTLTPIQPLIAPLYDGRSTLEVMADLGGRPMARGHALVREAWRALRPDDESDEDFERAWRQALHDGLVADTRFDALDLAWDRELELEAPRAAAGGLEVVFRADSCVYDGRFANNGWLQELPRAITRLVWDNAALIAPATAERLGLATEEVVELRIGERTLSVPVWITPGAPEDVVGLQLGGGRVAGGRLANGVGYDAYGLRDAQASGWAAGLELTKKSSKHLLVSVQDHRRMDGRDILRVRNLSRFGEPDEHPGLGAEGGDRPGHVGDLSMFPPIENDGYAWGMVIDLSTCIGCNACMIACQAENNVPVVGKDQVAVGREMHWLRIDQYIEGDEKDPIISHQPLPCMQCELASCELVCPVGATVHGKEGLNEMVYNRCVGTRYCANNCPYKVRKFNFFNYGAIEEDVEALGKNPDVSVRSRGVMEKCTYCVQRISRARIDSKLGDVPIRDGELQTACQQVCPTQAIVFGDIHDDDSAVSGLREQSSHYTLLEELGTKPRTTYLEKFRNLNPELEA